MNSITHVQLPLYIYIYKGFTLLTLETELVQHQNEAPSVPYTYIKYIEWQGMRLDTWFTRGFIFIATRQKFKHAAEWEEKVNQKYKRMQKLDFQTPIFIQPIKNSRIQMNNLWKAQLAKVLKTLIKSSDIQTLTCVLLTSSIQSEN